MNKPWSTFFFESNMFFDHISNMDDWGKLREAYPNLSDEELLNAKEATYNGTRSAFARINHPNYGFRGEHDGDHTLLDFFNQHGMSIPNLIEIGE